MVTSAAFAQDITVTGTVTDASTGEPVVGATVLLKGSTTQYAMTDDLGSYSITVPSDGVLDVTFLGYSPLEVPVNGRTVIDIQLEMEAEMLEDVIVVAYGTVRREAATGSVSTVSGSTIAEAPVTSVDKMLQGKVAGLTVTSNSGQPGATSNIRIRGNSSINAGNEPLWVVDGIPIVTSDNRALSNAGVGDGGTTASINPNDIESITVLKDAAAASIYGSRAANGVILVTTKSGKAGQSRFTARVKFGASVISNDNNYRPLTGDELYNYWTTSITNAGYDPTDPSNPYYNSLPAEGTDLNATDWYKSLTKTGLLQEYEINASGGNDKATYYSSLSYHRNQGVFYGVDYQRFSARVNADFQLLKTLKTGTRVNLSYVDSDSPQFGSSYYSNPAFSMFRLLPWTPMYNEDGTYNVTITENSNTNPRAVADYDEYNDKEYRVQGTMYLQWNPIRQLEIKTNNSVEGSFVNSRQYWHPYTNSGSATAFTYRIQQLRLTTSNTITFNDNWGNHSFRAMAGQEAMMDTYNYVYLYSPQVNPDIPYPNTSTAAVDEGSYYYAKETLLSFFGNVDYSYDNRYFVSASIRGDGSSLFGSNTKWGLFWSASASWTISNEDWMDGVSNWWNLLKLRASYGVNGNNNISVYQAYGLYAVSAYNNFSGMLPSQPSNPNLSWEKNKTWNIGLDLGFWDNRLTASVDVYSRLTDDMLLSVSVPQTTGFSSNLMNTGSVRNNGVEIMVDGEIIRNADWLWTAGVNMAFNRSKVLDLAGSGFLTATDSRSGQSTPVRIVEGMSMYNFYLRDYYGVDPTTGDALFWTEDGKLTNDRTQARYIYAGSPEPLFSGGFNTSVSWKGLSLSAFFDFTYGNDVVVGNWYHTDGESLSTNLTADVLDYWTKPGDTGTQPRPVAGANRTGYTGYSTRYLEDGSYLRIRDVTLSYSLPQKATDAMRIKGLRLYVSALNLYTFHDVTAMDPELGYLGYAYGGNYPMTKSFVGGIELTF